VPEALDAFAQLASGRRSVRRYEARAVPEELLEKVMACALQAPSPHNRQPVRLALVRSRERLADAMGERLRADRSRDGDASEAIETDIMRSRARIVEAPALVLLALSMQDMDRYADAARQQAEYLMAVQSAAMAGQNLMLAAHAGGLAACWMCAPLFCPQAARDALGLPAHWQPQGLVTLGYAAAPGKRRPKKSLKDVLKYLPEEIS
jgi:F420 biosynthesis protein FbiB-like protein